MRGATEGINLLANTFGKQRVGEGDEIIDIAHSFGVPVIVDGAQSVSHMRVNVQVLDADFFVFLGTIFLAQPGSVWFMVKQSICNTWGHGRAAAI